VIFKPLSQISNRQKGKNSPDLVTLNITDAEPANLHYLFFAEV
jgi:hypothetical protein